jgi:hypothetical protein
MTVEVQSEVPVSPDREAIVRTIELYIDGFAGRIDKFRECFHPDARMTFTGADGQLVSLLISDCFEEWATYGPWDHRILSVTQAGDVASVMLEMHQTGAAAAVIEQLHPGQPGTTNSWVDIHSLLRIDGTWKDMNKTATHGSKADWAGLR